MNSLYAMWCQKFCHLQFCTLNKVECLEKKEHARVRKVLPKNYIVILTDICNAVNKMAGKISCHKLSSNDFLEIVKSKFQLCLSPRIKACLGKLESLSYTVSNNSI